ncbi:MAG: hypothetical protein AAB347_05400 [Bacteroidota bacterium]
MILKSKMYETTKNNQDNQVDQKNQGSDNLPHVRFPEFKDEWEQKRLSELLSESKKRNGNLKYDKDWIRRLLDLLNSRTLKLT